MYMYIYIYIWLYISKKLKLLPILDPGTIAILSCSDKAHSGCPDGSCPHHCPHHRPLISPGSDWWPGPCTGSTAWQSKWYTPLTTEPPTSRWLSKEKVVSGVYNLHCKLYTPLTISVPTWWCFLFKVIYTIMTLDIANNCLYKLRCSSALQAWITAALSCSNHLLINDALCPMVHSSCCQPHWKAGWILSHAP